MPLSDKIDNRDLATPITYLFLFLMVVSLQETSKKSVLKAIAAQDMLQDETESKTGLDEMADKKKLGLSGGLP